MNETHQDRLTSAMLPIIVEFRAALNIDDFSHEERLQAIINIYFELQKARRKNDDILYIGTLAISLHQPFERFLGVLNDDMLTSMERLKEVEAAYCELRETFNECEITRDLPHKLKHL